jgi:hypothetical protein
MPSGLVARRSIDPGRYTDVPINATVPLRFLQVGG